MNLLPIRRVVPVTLFLAAGCGGSPPPPSAPVVPAKRYSVDDELRSKTKSVPLEFLGQAVGTTTLAGFRESHPDAEDRTSGEGARLAEYRLYSTDEKPIEFTGQPIPRVDFTFYGGKLLAITAWFDTENFDEIEKGLIAAFGEGIPVVGNRMWKTDKRQRLQITGRSTKLGTFHMTDEALSEAMQADAPK